MKYRCNKCNEEFDPGVMGSPKCPKCGETVDLKPVFAFARLK